METFIIFVMFKLILLEDARRFLKKLPPQVMKKIIYNIDRVVGGEINAELFKKLEGTEIWEFGTLYNRNSYRLFAFWDSHNGTFVVATHGIVKKTRKTPCKEITKAEAIMKEYFNDKG